MVIKFSPSDCNMYMVFKGGMFCILATELDLTHNCIKELSQVSYDPLHYVRLTYATMRSSMDVLLTY